MGGMKGAATKRIAEMGGRSPRPVAATGPAMKLDDDTLRVLRILEDIDPAGNWESALVRRVFEAFEKEGRRVYAVK